MTLMADLEVTKALKMILSEKPRRAHNSRNKKNDYYEYFDLFQILHPQLLINFFHHTKKAIKTKIINSLQFLVTLWQLPYFEVVSVVAAVDSVSNSLGFE